MDKLRAARPSRAQVELRLGFAVESGKLTALWVSGKADASLPSQADVLATLRRSSPEA